MADYTMHSLADANVYIRANASSRNSPSSKLTFYYESTKIHRKTVDDIYIRVFETYFMTRITV